MRFSWERNKERRLLGNIKKWETKPVSIYVYVSYETKVLTMLLLVLKLTIYLTEKKIWWIYTILFMMQTHILDT